MIRLNKYLTYLLFLPLWLAACSPFEKVRKSSDVNYKLTKANEYYDKKQYSHANELYKELMPIMKSTRNYEALFYRYSYTFYYLKEFLEASYYFKNYAEFFPISKEAEECEFMSAVCLFKYAPKYTLDQTNSIKALEALQSFVTRYPQSTYNKEANTYIMASHSKLETKDAAAAKLYYNIEQYKASATAYKSILRNYPESATGDLYQYMIMKSMYKYAQKSVPEKQIERYEQALLAYRTLKDNYPSSAYLPEAETLSQNINQILKK
ncbi:MAG: outer membrane protein assembly factor BamD [Chitinophagia bacterium]|nr:outer membrane protein assembly factor BamD [Chitinophagia bacterium]